ncbi:MAG: Crp/Fnr family transcriptional regulator [Saprospiraceae bacterium]
MTTSREQLIESFPLFSCLNSTERTALANMMEERRKERFEFIYRPEDSCDHLFFLAKGAIKIGTHNQDGKEVIKQLLHPEAIFGELGLVGQQQRGEFARVLRDDVVIFAIRIADFQGLMYGNADLARRVMKVFGHRLIAAEDRLEGLIFKDARTRIIDFIRKSVEQRGLRIGFEMLLKHSLTHQDIANVTCTSRQTVTLVLNELRKSDLIYFNRGKILVRDMEALRTNAA